MLKTKYNSLFVTYATRKRRLKPEDAPPLLLKRRGFRMAKAQETL